jgi:hypothetical protein
MSEQGIEREVRLDLRMSLEALAEGDATVDETFDDVRTLFATPPVPAGKVGELVEDFLHELDGWEQAYPLSMFPEPDMRKAAELLKSGGIALDAVSASNMRHVVSQIAPKARAAIAALSSRCIPR